MQVRVRQSSLLELFHRHKDSKGKQAKLKSPAQLQELLDITRVLLEVCCAMLCCAVLRCAVLRAMWRRVNPPGDEVWLLPILWCCSPVLCTIWHSPVLGWGLGFT